MTLKCCFFLHACIRYIKEKCNAVKVQDCCTQKTTNPHPLQQPPRYANQSNRCFSCHIVQNPVKNAQLVHLNHGTNLAFYTGLLANEKESADILKDLRNAPKKPSVQKTQGEASPLQPPPRSVRNEPMAAIRGSSIGSLKRGGLLDRD